MSSFYPCRDQVPDDAVCACGNCAWRGPFAAAGQIQAPEDRLTPGEEIPAGECPECGALAYLEKQPAPVPARAIPDAPEHLFPWLYRPWDVWQDEEGAWNVGVRAVEIGRTDYHVAHGVQTEAEARYLADLHNAQCEAAPAPVIVREFSAAGPCLRLGRLVKTTPQFFLFNPWQGGDRYGEEVRRIARRRHHIEPCPSCTDHPKTMYPHGYMD